MAGKLYTSAVWKLLDFNIRADLLPVAEGVKKGTEIGVESDEQNKLLNQWLKKSNLAHKPNGLVHFICKDESLLDKLWQREISIDDFLGYPKCCIKNHRDFDGIFIKYLNDEIKFEEVPLPWGMVIGREIMDAIKNGKYDDALYYVLHMPCSAYCQKSIKFGRKIKNCLEKNDPEVAEWLRLEKESDWHKFGSAWTEETWHKFAEERKQEVNSLKE